MDVLALQDRYAPDYICFGCGPANPGGLRLKSHVAGDEVVASWLPGADMEAFAGILNGGIVSALLDCHSLWTAAHHLMVAAGLGRPPVLVTADLRVQFHRPTPSDLPLTLRARVVEATARRVTVEATLAADGVERARATSTFVAIKSDHPAYGSW
jgi:acyl-coenzyme A thioesterase PaaI-like protein